MMGPALTKGKSRHVMGLRIALTLLVLILLPTTASCQSAQPLPGKPPHHTSEGFRNTDPIQIRSLWEVAKWRWLRIWDGIPERHNPGPDFSLAENNPEFLRTNTTVPTLTWIGHAGFLLQVGGVNLLTDPHMSERASPFSWAGPKRLAPPGLTMEQLPTIHAVLISHNHYDHLDVGTVRALARRPENPRFFVPLGLKAWFADLDIFNVVEMDWWEEAEYLGLRIMAVEARHFSRRGPFDAMQTLWAGWAVLHPTLRFYHAGDTGYGAFFKEIRRRIGPLDLVALPIGAYEPRWFMKEVHLNPAEAVQAYQDLQARYAVGMHWGMFDLTDELPETPPRVLQEELVKKGIPGEKFFVLQHGETRPLAPLLPAKRLAHTQ